MLNTIRQIRGAEFDQPTQLGGTSRMKIDLNGGYNRIYALGIKVSGVDTTQPPLILGLKLEDVVEQAQLFVNQNVQMTLTPRQQKLFTIYDNATQDPYTDNVLVIPFTRPMYLGSSWGTKDIASLAVTVKTVSAATLGAGKTFTGLSSVLYVEELAEPQDRGSVFQYQTVEHIAKAGKNVWEDVPLTNMDQLSRIIADSPGVQDMIVQVGDEIEYDQPLWGALEGLKRNPLYKTINGNPATEGVFPAFFDVAGNPGKFPRISDLERRFKKPVKITYEFDTTVPGAAVGPVKFHFEGVSLGANALKLAKA